MNTLRVLKHSMVQRYSKSQHDTHKASPSHSHLDTSVYTRKKKPNALTSPLPSLPHPPPSPSPSNWQKAKNAMARSECPTPTPQAAQKKELKSLWFNHINNSFESDKEKTRNRQTGKHHRNQPLSRVLAVPLFLRNPLTHRETNRSSSPSN